MYKIKKTIINILEYLNREPDSKHPRFRHFPNFFFNILDLLANFIFVIIVFKLLTKIINYF